MTKRFTLVALLLLTACKSTTDPHSEAVESSLDSSRCFDETGFCIGGPIRAYWEDNGGLATFGLPVSAQINADIDGWQGQHQWFERDRLEDHGGDVIGGRVGARYLELIGTPWESIPRSQPAPGCDFFPETQHNLCEPFRSNFYSRGGLIRFGFPLTEAHDAALPGFQGTVQYFERRRMERHVELAGTEHEVLLGLLGRDVMGMERGIKPLARAMVMVDTRLFAKLKPELTEYVRLAEERRGFPIQLEVVSGLDGMSPEDVKNYIKWRRAEYFPHLEGLLLVGNVTLPTFYKVRNDIVQARPFTHFYEDLDGTFEKRYPDGSVDPKCAPNNQPNCNVERDAIVPPHDYDFMAKGPNSDPEIYVAVMPVGFSDAALNTYDAWANQLRPYLLKLHSYYRREQHSNGRFYFVSNDDGQDQRGYWEAFGPQNIDFYGKPGPNGETGNACLTPQGNVCYERWPLETFPSPEAFAAEHSRLWVGENWQKSDIFLAHLNPALYDVVEVNTHGNGGWVLAGTREVYTLTGGAPIVMLDGCSTTEFKQPKHSRGDSGFAPGDNVALAYLYGPSKAVAVSGAPQNRGNYAHNPTVYRHLRNQAHMGRAHLERMKLQYANAGTSPWDLRTRTNELLAGDPFFDLGLVR